MKNTLFVALSTLLLLCLSACKKDKIIDPPPPPPTNRIDYLLVDEWNAQLLIYGKFPDTKGSVTIENEQLSIKTWSSPLIICDVPYTNAVDYGDIVVHSSDTKSAPRRLYKWTIDVVSKRPHVGLGGTIMEEAVCQVFIRGDAKAVPTHVFTAGYDELFPGGTAKYSAGGTTGSSYDCGTMTAEWTSFTNFLVVKSPGMEDLSSTTHFQGFKTFQPSGFDLFLDFVAWELIPAKVTTNPCGGSSSVYEYMQSSQVLGLDTYDPIPLRFEPGKNNFKSDSITTEVYNSAKLMWRVESCLLYTSSPLRSIQMCTERCIGCDSRMA